MKTKPANCIPTALPTCGEVFHFWVAAIDLPGWANLFRDSGSKTKPRDAAALKAISDQLRDWATEAEGRVPSHKDFEGFIRTHTQPIPMADELCQVLCSVWGNLLADHTDEVRENTTYLNREGTRAWYALTQAPRILYFLWVLQKLFQRIAKVPGPMLDVRLDEVLLQAWPEFVRKDVPPAHPLYQACYSHFARLFQPSNSPTDAKTIADWSSGEARPRYEALGRHFNSADDKLGMLLNFAYAGLIESIVATLQAWLPSADRSECRSLLLRQAACMRCLDDSLANAEIQPEQLSLVDYERLLGHSLGTYMELLRRLEHCGEAALDLSVARFRVYREYHQLVEARGVPADFTAFYLEFEHLWKRTSLEQTGLAPDSAMAELVRLRKLHVGFSEVLAGPMLAIEARLALWTPQPTKGSLLRALSLYQSAQTESRYCAGQYAKHVTREALGLAALLHRREMGEGTIKPWIKKVLAWWDLLRMGADFDHEQPDQRIELAESRFTDGLNTELRDRLKAALPEIGLNHWNIGSLAGFSDPGFHEQLQGTPVDRRQKRPMEKTLVGRTHTALMEAIDRRQLDLARELLHRGADLNFINSTGDTCVTKAFAAKYYDLILEILQRDTEPIRRETIMRVTNKKKISGLEQTLSEGRVEILRELASWKNGRGDVIDMNKERVWGQTPLYYAINCLLHFRASPAEAVQHARKFMPGAFTEVESTELLKLAHEHLAKEYNPQGVMACIDYLVNELEVNLDAPNACDNSALTLAAECRLHEVAALLLDAGANVNHRFQGGGTALVRAIQNDDYEMAKLLIEYQADASLYVDALGRRICLMAMSEKMRRLIPERA